MKHVDMHAHSHISIDGNASIADMAAAALAAGLAGIAITDHVDWHPKDMGFCFYRQEDYDREIARVREEYAGRLLVLRGIEADGGPWQRRAYAEQMARELDVVVGGTHWVGGAMSGDPTGEGRGFGAFFYAYCKQVIAALRLGGIDVLAHIDFPLRYFGEREMPEALVDEVLGEVARRDVALEINTSGLRKGPLGRTLPGPELLRRFVAVGGKYVTLGSDAHRPGDVGAGLDIAYAQALEAGLEVVYFIGRELTR